VIKRIVITQKDLPYPSKCSAQEQNKINYPQFNKTLKPALKQLLETSAKLAIDDILWVCEYIGLW